MPICAIHNPLASHYLAHLRRHDTDCASFRTLARKLSMILVMEAAKSIPTKTITIQTPLESMQVEVIEEDVVLIPVLRAGLGMLEGAVELLPKASVGYVGLERDENTAIARSYYHKTPNLAGRHVILLDPMLATGGSALMALKLIYEENPASVQMLCIVAAPEGVEALLLEYPYMQIVVAAIDRELNGVKYILPGLGDFGDRLYGTN